MKREGLDTVSHEMIYQMIYANHQGLGTCQQSLRQSQKKRRRRKGVNAKRGGIPDRIGIELRPAIADLKTEIGHWESDTVIGGGHIGAIVTHVDKASKFLRLFWVLGDKQNLYVFWKGFQPPDRVYFVAFDTLSASLPKEPPSLLGARLK